MKWAGAAAALLLAGAWAVTLRADAVYFTADGSALGVSEGSAVLAGPARMYAGLGFGWTPRGAWVRPALWSWSWGHGAGWGPFTIAGPLWPPAVLCAAASAWAWRLDERARRRALAGRCPRCRYDRAGLAPGAACPECGAGAAAGARAVT